MSIFLLLLKNYWKYIIIVVLLLSVSVYAYRVVYKNGYEAAQVECNIKLRDYEEKMIAYKKDLDSRIKLLEDTSIKLVKETEEEKSSVKKDLTKIITVFKDKPLVVIEKEKCSPSIDFISTYNQAVARVNR
jgi:hypothetical protein